MSSKVLSCYLIGETGLAIKCAEILLEKGWKILGFISKDAIIQNWARQNHISFCSSIDEARINLQEIEFDYIFNIASSTILLSWLLNQPRQLAINYHDAPLPHYAGAHATSWAILNNEKQHGITWHIMTEQINEGDILKQSAFEVSDTETVLSLNVKCYERGIQDFRELINALIDGNIKRVSQTKSQRTFFHRNKKPLGGGILDWSLKAKEIECLCRAIDFGTYQNHLVAPKLVIAPGTVYIPLKCKSLPSQGDDNPGEIISLTDSSLEVSTSEGIIKIGGFLDEHSNELSPLAIKQRHHLVEKQCLPIFSKEYLKKFTEKLESYNSSESYWIKQWQNAQPCQLPWKYTPISSGTNVKTISWFLPEDVKQSLKQYQNTHHAIIAASLTYLSKLTQKTDFTLYFQDESLAATHQEYPGLLADFIPFNVTIRLQGGFRAVYQHIEDKLTEIKNHNNYPIDLMHRYRQILKDIPQLSMALILTATPDKVCLPSSVSLGVIIDSYNQNIYIKTNLPDECLEYINHIPSQLEGLFFQVLNKPEVPLQQISLITAQELMLLARWNETQHEYPKDKSIHQLFEETVERVPDTIAIVYEEQQISYSALNERANQLAYYLQSLGLKAEDRVGVALPRGVDLIVGLFAVLKSGGVYIPLDVEYPQDRLAYMLEDSNAQLLLSIKGVGVPEGYSGRIIYLDEEIPYLNQPTRNPSVDLYSDNLAYITYTSGSTGKPKGVACDHKGVINRLYWGWTNYSFKENETCCLQSSIAFVDSTWDIFGTLLVGARLILYKEAISKDIEDLLKICFIHKVTRITLIPSFLNTMLHFSSEKLSLYKKYLAHWEITGESFQPNLIDNFFKQMGQTLTLLDCYGATEATSVIYRDFIAGSNFKYQTKILSNTYVYLLDAHLNFVPIGVEGEIYIGGVELARGYLNKPGLTAERFIPDPFKEGCRLYKTGDLGRYLLDGNIEFLGRIDHQLKLRGFRIELGEIEGTLAAIKGVQETVVLCREDVPGQKRLVAYISGSSAPIPTELRQLLTEKLPEYMIPSFFVYLDHFPLTPNGKIDRKALPAPDTSLRLVGGAYIAPTTEVEVELCKIWSEVLGVESIGIHDNFFELGGHSLLATQVVSRIRKNLTVELPLKALFSSPTIAGIEEEVCRLQGSAVLTPPIVAETRPERVPLSFAQQRLWFLDQLIPNQSIYNIPMAFHLKGVLDVEALEHALVYLMQRHEILRTHIESENGEAYQVIRPNSFFKLDRVSLVEKEELARELVRAEALQPFDLEKDSLIRAKLLTMGTEEYIFLLSMHHIVSDGWSLDVLLRELKSAYEAYREGKEPELSPLCIQYADFTLWQRGWLQGEVLEKQLAYWKKELEGVQEVIALPTDHSRPQELSYRGGLHVQHISKELLAKIKALGESQGSTLFMTLLAAFQTLLYRYTGQEDIVVGSPIANRHYKEIEGLIGFFVNTLALRARVTGSLTFHDLLIQTRETTLNAYAHQDVPFEQLVDHLEIPREINRNPVFQVLFVLQNTGNTSFELEGMDSSVVGGEAEVAKFDLSLFAQEVNDGLVLSFEYAKDLFEPTTIERLSHHFMHLLQEIVVSPEKQLNMFSFLTTKEKEQLLVEWNQTEIDYPKNKTVYQLFEEQVEKKPNNSAVIYEDEELTYQELNEKANQLAHYLRSHGVGPDTLVAIAVERSLEMIIGLLGILKAGGAYVPLDPSYPEDRLQFMLENTQSPVLLTQSHLKERFGSYSGKLLSLQLDLEKGELLVDESSLHLSDSRELQWISLASQSSQNLKTLNSPYHLAYVIYTSGSTGKPKGVMIQHDSLFN